jgi:hypothetical protein
MTLGRQARELCRVSKHDALVAEIKAELAGSRRDLAQVERTLADGYANVLVLEAERLRLTRRVANLVGVLEGGDVNDKTKELSSLTKELEAQDSALKLLRTLLGELRTEYSRGMTVARGRPEEAPAET